MAVLERLLFDDGLEQRAFVGELDIKRALGDRRGASDLAHAGAVKAEIHEDLAGTIHDLAALGAVFSQDDLSSLRVGCNHWFRFSQGF